MKNRENGIALLFSLVYLSMITLILTAIVFTLRTEEMFTNNMKKYDSSMAKAKFFEKQIVENLEDKEFDRNCFLTPIDKLRYPLRYCYCEPDIENCFDYQRTDEMSLEFDFGFNPFIGVANNANSIDWSFVRHDDNTYYRNIFVMVNEGGKFDLNGLLYGHDNELAMMNLYNLEKLLKVYGVIDAKKIARKLKTKRLRQESEDKRVPWLSWRQIWRRKVFTSDLDYVSPAEEKSAVDTYHALSTHTTASPECYRYNDYKNLKTVSIHRFYLGNLAKMNRSSILDVTLTENIATQNFFDESLRVTNVFEEMGVLTNRSNKNIPWLGQIKGCLKKEKHDTQIQNQVVANLIDYSDNDSRATTDYSPYRDYSSNDLFNYCGLEKSPYLAKGIITLSTENGELIPQIGFVLANFYDPAEVKVVIKATLDINGQLISVNELVDNLKVSEQSLLGHFTPTTKIKNSITNVVTIKNITYEIYREGELADVSLIKNMGTGEPFILTDGRNYYSSFSFRDPKCNNGVDFKAEGMSDYIGLYLDRYNDWKMYDGDKEELLKYDPDKLAGYSEDPVIDRETSNNLCDLSTSVIRNGIIRSFWELGSIHRGEPWRTLNLKGTVKFSPQGRVVTFKENSGEFNKYFNRNLKTHDVPNSRLSNYSGLYQHGDMALLEQVKLSKQAFSYPQISPLSVDRRYWRYLIEVWADFNCTVKSPFMEAGDEDHYYLISSELTESETERFCTQSKNIESLPILNRETVGHLFFDISSDGHLKEKHYSAKDDLYQEELVTKVASDLKSQSCFYRMISTTQKLERLQISKSFRDKKKRRNVKELSYSVEGIRNRDWFLIDYKIKRMLIIKYDSINHQFIVTRKIEDW